MFYVVYCMVFCVVYCMVCSVLQEAYETKVSHSMLKRFDHHYLRIKAEHVKMEKEKDELTKAEHERLKQKKLKAIAAASKLLSSVSVVSRQKGWKLGFTI